MTAGLVDRAAAIAARHERALTIAGAIWFWAGIAIYARFVELPRLVPEAWRPWVFWLSVGFNAAWWGFIRPAAERRRGNAPSQTHGAGGAEGA